MPQPTSTQAVPSVQHKRKTSPSLDNDNASLDGTDIDTSSDGRLEGWDEETALAEMLGSPYSVPFSLAHDISGSSDGVQRIPMKNASPGAYPHAFGRFTWPA
jgi:hypothetical protein